MKGFRPYGYVQQTKSPVVIHTEEYQALRLCDYERLKHAAAAEQMNVSRPTFTRIYAELRRKLATAFVENRTLILEGGRFEYQPSEFVCNACAHTFFPEENTAPDAVCPRCGAKDTSEKRRHLQFDSTYCRCQTCGLEYLHKAGQPCREMTCEKCGTPLRRTDK